MLQYESMLSPKSVFILEGAENTPKKLVRTLAYGKGYRPRPPPKPPPNLFDDIKSNLDTYVRRIRLRSMFGESSFKAKLYYPNPRFHPPPSSPAVEAYISRTKGLIYSELDNINDRFYGYKALMTRNKPAKGIRTLNATLKSLNLCVGIADKNLGLVVIHTADYDKAMVSTLSSSAFRPLTVEQGRRRLRAAYKAVKRVMRRALPPDPETGKRPNLYHYVVDSILPPDHSQPPFTKDQFIRPYALFKMHKNKNSKSRSD